MDRRRKTLVRIMISSFVGVVVAIIAILVAWQNLVDTRHVRPYQWTTQSQIRNVDEAVQEYRQATDAMPNSLDDIRTLVDAGLFFPQDEELLDAWERPFVYSTDGTNYTLISYGRDGKPGGVGLDCDLSNIVPAPPASTPTFLQFLFGKPASGMTWSCIVCGVLAFILSWQLVEPDQLRQGRLVVLAIQLIVTTIGAIIVAAFIAMLHQPSGH